MRRYWIIFIFLGISATRSAATYMVSASFGIMWTKVGIFEENLTRSEAAQRCVDYGFDSLEDGALTFIRYIAIKQKLQEELSQIFNNQPVNFWVDFFRLDSSFTIWLQTEQCLIATERVSLAYDSLSDENCVAVKFEDGFYHLSHAANKCIEKHPFICVKKDLTLLPFTVYSEVDVSSLPQGCTTDTLSYLASYEECEAECLSIYDCIAVTYFDYSGSCKLYMISPNKAWVDYELTYRSRAKHGAKHGTEVNFFSSSTTSVHAAVGGSLPCSLSSEITPPTTSTTSTTATRSTTSTTSTTPASLWITAHIESTERPEIYIHEEKVTWFDAVRKCSENGGQLDGKSYPLLSISIKIKQYLRDIGYSYSGNLTFWTGTFKPTKTTNKWYFTRNNMSECYESEKPRSLPDGADEELRCSLLTISGIGLHDTATLSADICSKNHSYYCLDWPASTVTFIESHGWNYTSVPTNTKETAEEAKTAEECADCCRSQWRCISWSFLHQLTHCHLIKIKGDRGHLTYEISHYGENVTHGYKEPYFVVLYRTSSKSNDTDFPQTFPTCSLTTTTTTTTTITTTTTTSTSSNVTSTSTSAQTTLNRLYSTTANGTCKRACPCRNTMTYNATELQAVVEEIIQNLTINKAETSKAKRELTSAEDTRPSAQAVGALGVAILSVVLAGIFIFDASRVIAFIRANA